MSTTTTPNENNNNNNTAGAAGKCKTQIQVKFVNLPDTVLNVPLTCTLGEQSQTKTIEEEGETDIAFNFKFKGDKKVKVLQDVSKAKPTPTETYCPQAGETLTGVLSSEDGSINQPISVTVIKTKGNKPTKVTYDLGGGL